jgi:hypothetical protein
MIVSSKNGSVNLLSLRYSHLQSSWSDCKMSLYGNHCSNTEHCILKFTVFFSTFRADSKKIVLITQKDIDKPENVVAHRFMNTMELQEVEMTVAGDATIPFITFAMNMTHDFEKALYFIEEIGIEVEFGAIPHNDCFLPGLLIEQGRIVVDRNGLQFPGDILHEAGHLAVVPAAERKMLSGNTIGERKEAPAEEMMTIAWSYAACIHLTIDPTFVFHEQGYKRGGAAIVENFRSGRYFGVPVLEWLGMTTTVESVTPVYPAMIKWLRD